MTDRTRQGKPPPLARPAGREGGPPTGHLGNFDLGATVAAAPDGPGRPYVLLGERFAHKLYRLSELRRLGTLERVRREAQIAAEVNAIDGVIGAERVAEHDGWLIIEMRRMDATLGDHLRSVEQGERRLSPAHYAHLLQQAGETLRRLHRRGIVHRDIKPDNLLLDSQRARLYVCDFSVSKAKGRALTKAEITLGTDRYIAPEQWHSGESSPASDQYSLAMVCRDVFASRSAPEVPRPLAQVLRTGTAADPEDRFAGVDGCRDLVEALSRAIDVEAPRTLADRLREAKPSTRYVWAPALLACAATWGELVLRRDPDLVVGLETLVLPLVTGAGGAAIVWTFNIPRGRRSRSGWALLDSWWVPWLIVLVLSLAARTVAGKPSWIWVAAGIPLGFAYLGAYPARCGYWLPALIERAQRLRRSQRTTTRFIAGVPAQMLVVLVVFLGAAYLPVAIGRAYPAPYDGPVANNSGALVAVRNFREALARNDVAAACSMMDGEIKTSSPCSNWMRLQVRFHNESVARARKRADGQPIFDDVEPDKVRIAQIAERPDIYSLATRGLGQTFGVLTVTEKLSYVTLTEGPSAAPKKQEQRPSMNYEVARQATFWRIHFPFGCTSGGATVEGTSNSQCVSPMRVAPDAIDALLKQPVSRP